jgi:hypothetical protein
MKDDFQLKFKNLVQINAKQAKRAILQTQNFVKRRVNFAKQGKSFCIKFRETKSKTSFAGNPKLDL